MNENQGQIDILIKDLIALGLMSLIDSKMESTITCIAIAYNQGMGDKGKEKRMNDKPSLICKDCKGYIFKGGEPLLSFGTYLTEDYDSEAICDDCMDSSHIEDD